MFRLINRKKGVSRSPEEWLKYANARFNEYNVLQPWEDAQKEEVEKQKEIGNKDKKEKQNEKKPSSTNATEKKSNSKSLAQEAASVENPACIESNDHQDCKEQNPSEKEPKKSFLNGINRNLATFTFSSLFMLTSADMSQWKLVATAFVLGMIFAKYGFVHKEAISAQEDQSKDS